MESFAISLFNSTRRLLNDDKTFKFSKTVFIRLKKILNEDQTEQKLQRLYGHAPYFDCHSSVPYNGLRSYFDVLAKSLEPIYEITTQIYNSDDRKLKVKNLNQWIDIFEQMLKVADMMILIVAANSKTLDVENKFPTFEEIIEKLNCIDQSVFFRSKIGFYMPHSMQPYVNNLASLVVGYRLQKSRTKGHFFPAMVDIAMMNKADYRLRAKYLAFFNNFVDPSVVTAIWNLTENPLLSFFNENFNRLSFNKKLTLPSTPLCFCSSKIIEGQMIFPPDGDPISARLVSYKLYNFLSNDSECENLAKDLIIHFHGGGFISQTSSSHLTYLTELSRATNLPILSIDYSLAPAAPFPQAVNECFFAYCWALQNLTYLGTRGQRIVLMGDSAGGNLVLAVAAKIISANLREPNALILAYPACSLSMNIMPSAFMSILDFFVSFSSFSSVASAYLNIDISSENEEIPEFSCFDLETIKSVRKRYNLGPWFGTAVHKIRNHDIRNDILVSPANLSDEMLKKLPPIRIFVGSCDPLLDDSVNFTKRLYDVGHDVEIDVIDGFPHGFLQLYGVSSHINIGIDYVIRKISLFFA